MLDTGRQGQGSRLLSILKKINNLDTSVRIASLISNMHGCVVSVNITAECCTGCVLCNNTAPFSAGSYAMAFPALGLCSHRLTRFREAISTVWNPRRQQHRSYNTYIFFHSSRHRWARVGHHFRQWCPGLQEIFSARVVEPSEQPGSSIEKAIHRQPAEGLTGLGFGLAKPFEVGPEQKINK